MKNSFICPVIHYCNLPLKHLLLSTVLNIRGFGYSHLIKDNILSEKTNKKFLCERKLANMWYQIDLWNKEWQCVLPFLLFSCWLVSDSLLSINCSMLGFPILHSLPEFAQTHVHWVSDAIQPSHPLSFPSPPALNLSHYQGLFQWVGSSHKVSKISELQL